MLSDVLLALKIIMLLLILRVPFLFWYIINAQNPIIKNKLYSWSLIMQIAYPSEVEGLGAQLLKVQDNIPICASIILQRLALHSLEVGPEWVTNQVNDLVKNR